LALARVGSGIAENSVAPTNCANFSVTGGGVAILFSWQLGYMKTAISELPAGVYRPGNKAQRAQRMAKKIDD
jgi:hypothetical protein